MQTTSDVHEDGSIFEPPVLQYSVVASGSTQSLISWIALLSLLNCDAAPRGFVGKHFEHMRPLNPGTGHTFVAQKRTELAAPPARQPQKLLRLSRCRKHDAFEAL